MEQVRIWHYNYTDCDDLCLMITTMMWSDFIFVQSMSLVCTLFSTKSLQVTIMLSGNLFYNTLNKPFSSHPFNSYLTTTYLVSSLFQCTQGKKNHYNLHKSQYAKIDRRQTRGWITRQESVERIFLRSHKPTIYGQTRRSVTYPQSVWARRKSALSQNECFTGFLDHEATVVT